MKTITRRLLGLVLLASLAVGVTACDSFLEVTNPNQLEAENIDPEQVKATYRDGVLDVVLTRIPEAGPRKVAITTD